jgi:hypothetical protein
MERPTTESQSRGLRCEEVNKWRRAAYEKSRSLRSKLRFVGLDVHAETITAEEGGKVRSLGTIPNRLESVRRMVGKLGPTGKLKCCYEAGPTGYVLYWERSIDTRTLTMRT